MMLLLTAWLPPLLLSSPSLANAQTNGITIKEWVIPTPNSTPHDIVADKNGVIWFTEINANKIGRFDPQTEHFSEFDIPTAGSMPHGLIVNDNNNTIVWFTELGAAKIGKLDVNKV